MHPKTGQNTAQQHVRDTISHMPIRSPPVAISASREGLSGDCIVSILILKSTSLTIESSYSNQTIGAHTDQVYFIYSLYTADIYIYMEMYIHNRVEIYDHGLLLEEQTIHTSSCL